MADSKKILRALFLTVVGVGFLCASSAFANYQAAQGSFARRDHTTAAALFFQAYGYSKNSAEKMKAEWGLAQSLHRLGLFYSASKYYSVIVRRGPRANNPFFRKALEELGNINATMSLGQSHIVQLFRTRIDPASVPGPARGFYFYYLGIEAFTGRKFEEAMDYFRRVPSGSPYYTRALFHLGVVSNLAGQHSQAINYFESVRNSARDDDEGQWLREVANLNIARVNYEVKRYRESIQYYAQIPRDSDNWLEAIFEAAWAFFLMQKHNNVLGNIHTIHSPFFENRFFPESYILQSITFLRLCRYDEVKDSLRDFRERYRPVFQDVKAMLDQYNGKANGFFRLIYDYRVGSLDKYKRAWAILDALSRTDVYREAGNTIRFSDVEISRLGRFGGRWASSGLQDELKTFLNKKKAAAVGDAGRRLYNKGTSYYAYLKELSDQTQLINAEMVLGRVNQLRAKLKVEAAESKANFIGGMQTLNVDQDLEYWPFEGEYWEDELGAYVYNIEANCAADKGFGEKKDK